MKDRLVTIALSVAATYGLMKEGPERPTTGGCEIERSKKARRANA